MFCLENSIYLQDYSEKPRLIHDLACPFWLTGVKYYCSLVFKATKDFVQVMSGSQMKSVNNGMVVIIFLVNKISLKALIKLFP